MDSMVKTLSSFTIPWITLRLFNFARHCRASAWTLSSDGFKREHCWQSFLVPEPLHCPLLSPRCLLEHGPFQPHIQDSSDPLCWSRARPPRKTEPETFQPAVLAYSHPILLYWDDDGTALQYLKWQVYSGVCGQNLHTLPEFRSRPQKNHDSAHRPIDGSLTQLGLWSVFEL